MAGALRSPRGRGWRAKTTGTPFKTRSMPGGDLRSSALFDTPAVAVALNSSFRSGVQVCNWGGMRSVPHFSPLHLGRQQLLLGLMAAGADWAGGHLQLAFPRRRQRGLAPGSIKRSPDPTSCHAIVPGKPKIGDSNETCFLLPPFALHNRIGAGGGNLSRSAQLHARTPTLVGVNQGQTHDNEGPSIAAPPRVR
jgi:hypothetical protein